MNLEQSVRDYLRSKTSLMALLNNDVKRVNMAWTGADQATRVMLYRAGGSQNGYMPLELAAITLHCFGSTRPAAADLADAVAQQMRVIRISDKPLLSASVESVSWLPTADGVARYVVTTLVTALIPALVA